MSVALFELLKSELEEEWNTVAANVDVTWTNNVAVDSARNAVVLLLVCLWKLVALINAGIGNILS